MSLSEVEVLISPFFRYSGIFNTSMQKKHVYGPRICYIPSLYYIESGKGQLIIEDETYELIPGMQIYVEQGKRHTWLLDFKNPLTFKFVYFEWCRRPETELSNILGYYCDPGDEFKQEMLHSPTQLDLKVCTKPSITRTWTEGFDRFQSTFEIINRSNDMQGLKIQGYFLIFLDEVLRGTGNQADPTDPRIVKVMKLLMEDRFGCDGTHLMNWQKITGLNRSRLFSLFKSGTGFTPKEYWNWCRMNEVKELLRTTQMSITEIADHLGYASVHSFSKSFTRTVGKNPSQYREEHRIF